MFVNKKHTNSDNLSCGNLFNNSVVHVSRTCLRIHLPLIVLILIVVLLRIGAFLGPMTHLIIVEVGLMFLGPAELPYPPFPLGKAMVNALRNTF